MHGLNTFIYEFFFCYIKLIAYELLYVKNLKNCKISAWINHIHKILNNSGMSYIWTLQNCISEKWLKLVIKNNLIDQFKQIWNSSIETSSKGIDLEDIRLLYLMILCLFI
jgi:hypothetical protein